MKKLHEYGGFKVDKNEIAALFSLMYNNPSFKIKQLTIESGFGKNKVENLRYYLKNFGLLDESYSISDLGELIYKYDKYFEDEFTLWILLINWANEDSNPSLYFIINKLSDPVEKDSIKSEFVHWANINGYKTDYGKAKDIVGGLVSRTLNSFFDDDAFKPLNVLLNLDEKYIKGKPYKVHPFIVAYVLYQNKNGRTTIRFEEMLHEASNIGRIFNLDHESLQANIYSLRDLNHLEYVQTANLDHIVYTFPGEANTLLSMYYEQY